MSKRYDRLLRTVVEEFDVDVEGLQDALWWDILELHRGRNTSDRAWHVYGR